MKSYWYGDLLKACRKIKGCKREGEVEKEAVNYRFPRDEGEGGSGCVGNCL